jgi:threonine aldolase
VIDRARRIRKQLGGGMRQAGVLASAGIVALEKMTSRLGEDHAAARQLADGIRGLPGVRLENDPPPTNMVFLEVADAKSWIASLAESGVLALAVGPRRIRLVTHYWIREEDVRRAAEAVRRVAGGKEPFLGGSAALQRQVQ